ncbi:acetylglutamate kinase [Camelliibacillus cellulosilyticus]|uniref:Acetylglutamate kinase n=1 Tax=Camelliibacillus cellulosilyticus TaxID=2174486 RepID=A0ABV9GHC7_9BACL
MKYVVIKLGGSILEDLSDAFYQTIVDLYLEKKWLPILVHGGGPMISQWLHQLQIDSSFKSGLRVTTREVLDVVESVLSGLVNKKIVRKLNNAGGKAIGLSGIDGHFLKAEPLNEDHSLGFVGKVGNVDKSLIHFSFEKGMIPVISPLAMDVRGERYNINADAAAAAIAQAMNARLCFISDVPGILMEPNEETSGLRTATPRQIASLIEQNVINGGMVPKVKAAVSALEENLQEVVILNGHDPNGLEKYALGQEIGTKIVPDEEKCHV